jgi:hypothetical protein
MGTMRRVAIAAWCLLLQGCAAMPFLSSSSGAEPWSTPEGTALYVAPIGDRSPGMAVGGPLWRETQEALWRRAPRRFLMVFHESALAIDVDVVAVLEAQADPDAGAGKRDVVVLVEGRVVDHDGVVVRDLGQLGRRGRYEVAADPQETARRRQAALMAARQTLAGAIAAAALTIP